MFLYTLNVKMGDACQIKGQYETGTESRKEWMLHQFKYYAGRHTRNEKYQLWTHENHAEELLPFLPEKELIDVDLMT